MKTSISHEKANGKIERLNESHIAIASNQKDHRLYFLSVQKTEIKQGIPL
ncbi:MAG: hypothetical protein ACP5US_09840 [Candidatus Kryptoniota bacterium]